jgi:hypothetical protein
LKPY